MVLTLLIVSLIVGGIVGGVTGIEILGIIVGGVMFFAGLPTAIEWGFIASQTDYIVKTNRINSESIERAIKDSGHKSSIKRLPKK